MKFGSLIILLHLLSGSNMTYAQTKAGLALDTGYISNDNGEKCWYRQDLERSKYFFEKWPSNIAIITFNDPKCMSDTGDGLNINKRQINNIISNWYLGRYTHEDANFQTDPAKLFNKSPLQISGKCMQSQTYSMIGILIDYKITNNSIVGVVHGSSVGACTD